MEWICYAIAVTILVTLYSVIVVKLMREQSFLQGRMESLQEDMKATRAECYALRERLRNSEIAQKGSQSEF